MDAPRVFSREDPQVIPVRIEECPCRATDRAGGASGAFCGLDSVPYNQEHNGKQRNFPADHVQGPQVLLEESEMIQSSMGKKIT
jgi:hypothetical protein